MSLIITRDYATSLIHQQMKGRWLERTWWTDHYENPPHLPHLLAPAYTKLTPVRLQRFLDWSQTDGKTRKARIYDCNGFAKSLWSDAADYSSLDWLGLQYPLLLGFIASVHTYNWCIMEDESLMFLEPQTDWILQPSIDPQLRPGHFNVDVMLV